MSRSGFHMDFVVTRRNAFNRRARRLGIGLSVGTSGVLQRVIVDALATLRQPRVAAANRPG